jgi:MFS transporter, CP family, cyanate transporter
MPIRGRVLALVEIILVAVNLRLAITSLSVLYDAIGKDVSGFSVTFIGILPLICFSIFGLLAHNVAEKIGFKKSLLIAMLAVFVGTLLRAFSSEVWTFAACTVVAGAGMAFGNVLLFPLIKKYFPDHIGGMTATYSVLIAVSSALPSALAIPVADAFHWRVSIGWWGIVALPAALP